MSGPDPRRRVPHPLMEHNPPRRTALPVRLWRRRTEILLLTVFGTLFQLVSAAAQNGARWLPYLVAGAILALVVARPSRDWLHLRFRCVHVRHRLYRLFAELRMYTRKGRVPLVLWVTPTRRGEKALLLCRAGHSGEAMAERAAEFRVACKAREVRFARHARRPDLVLLELIRRDPLPGDRNPGLEAAFGHEWIPIAPEPEQTPVLDRSHG